MAEEPTTEEPTAPVEPAQPVERTVPYERFAEVNQAAREAKGQLKEMQDRLQELEDRDKTELERERTKALRLEQDLQDREARLQRSERGGWVRDAAQELKFHDPTDAVARANLGDIESEAEARTFVKALAKDKKHLVQVEQERPQVGQVLNQGQRADPNAPTEQQTDEGEKFVEELRAALKGNSVSIPGLLDG